VEIKILLAGFQTVVIPPTAPLIETIFDIIINNTARVRAVGAVVNNKNDTRRVIANEISRLAMRTCRCVRNDVFEQN